jgi:hypothetical protein
MAVKFANNVSTTLSAAINATQTTISVADASGLPTLSSGDYIYLTIDTDTNSPTIEVVKVTGVSTNTLTVVRGQDGTTASSFSNGTKVELRVTAAALDDISSAADTESVSISGDTMTGSLTTPGLTVNGSAILGSTASNYDQYVRGNSNVGLRIQTNAQGTGGADGMRIGLNGVHGFVWQFEEKPLAFATSGTERLSISAGGSFDFKGGNFSGVGTISSGAITSSGKISASSDLETATRLVFTNNIANGWSAPIIFRESAHLALSDYSGVKLGGYNGTAYGPRFHVAGNGNVNILEGSLMMGGTTVIDSNRDITARQATFTHTTHNYVKIEASINAEQMVRFKNSESNYWYAGIRTSAGIASTADFHIYSTALADDVFALTTSGDLVAKRNLNTKTGGVQINGTTVINSARSINNVTLGALSTGARFEHNNWHQSSDGYNRFYFANASHTYFRTGSAYIFRDNGDTGRATISANGGLNLRSGGDGLVGSTVALAVSGTTVLDSSRNLSVGTISSGAITASSYSGSLVSSVTATTQLASDNSTKVATTAYVTTAIDNIVDAAPGSLDTLNELAAALGDDANFSTTVTNSIATKLPLAGGTMTGTIDSHVNDLGVILKSGNSSATGAPDQFKINHNFGNVEIQNLRGSINFPTVVNFTNINDINVNGTLNLGNSATSNHFTGHYYHNRYSNNNVYVHYYPNGNTTNSNTYFRFPNGTSFRALSFEGANMGWAGAIIAASTIDAGSSVTGAEGIFGSASGSNQGIQIKSGTGTGDYGRIRYYEGTTTQRNTIHFFGRSWQGGSVAGHATGTINLDGDYGVTFGGWTDIDAYIDGSGIHASATRGYYVGSTVVIDSSRNITAGTISSGAQTLVANATIIESLRNPSQSWGEYALTRYGTEGANFRFMDFGYYRGTTEATRGLVIKSQAFATLFTFLDSGAFQVGTTTVIDSSRNLTNIGKLNTQDIGTDGTGFTGMGFGYSSNTLTRAVGSGVQWYKVASFSGGVKAITMRVSAGGDNTIATDTFFISGSSYGMKANIMKFPSTRYNDSKLMEVRTKFVSGATYEIWVKLNSITTSNGNLHVSMNDSGVVSSLSAGTEPTYNSLYDATLVVTALNRNDYAIQTTGKIETNEGYAVNDQVFIDSNRNISNVGNITSSGQLRLNDGADIAWAGGYGSNNPLISANGNLLRFYTTGASGGIELELSSSSANFQNNSITTTGNIARTGTEGREIQTYMASSYTTNDIVAGHEYGWYSDYWRIGMSRSNGVAGEAFRFNYSGSYVAQIGTTGIFDGTGYRVSGTTVIDSNRDLTARQATFTHTDHNYIMIEAPVEKEQMVRFKNSVTNYWYAGIRTSAGIGNTTGFHIFSTALGNDTFALDTSGNAYVYGYLRTNNVLSRTGSTGIKVGGFSTANTDETGSAVVEWQRGTGWDNYLIKGSTSRGVFGTQFIGEHIDSSKSWGVFSSGWDTEFQINGDGRSYIKGPFGVGSVPATTDARFHVTGLNTTDGTARFTPDSGRGTRVSHIHYGSTGDWYIRSASTSGTVHIQDGGGAAMVNGNAIWHGGNDGSGSGLDADLLDGFHKDDFDHFEKGKKWTGISASAAQSRRFHIARLYGCPAHWDSNWQNIEFHITAETYESATLKFRMQGDYTGGNQNTMLQLHLTEAHGPLAGDFRFVMGTPVSAGWNHSGQPTYYIDLFAEARYYAGFTVHAKTYGHSYQTSNPTSGGATTVFYSSPTVTNISDFGGQTHMEPKHRGYTVWNAGNHGSASGLDADMVDNLHASQFLRSDANDTSTGVITFDQATQLFRKNNATNYYTGSLMVESYGGASSIAAMGFHISGSIGRMLSMNSAGTLTYEDDFSAISLQTNSYKNTDGTFMFRWGTNSGTSGFVNFADNTSDPSAVGVGTATVRGITWGQRTDNNPYYMIYPRHYNNGSSTHSRLVLGWHTGVEIGAEPTYGGTRFFNNSPFTGSEIMSVGKGDSNVRVVNSLYIGGSVDADAKRHDFGVSSGWDTVGFGYQTNVHFQGHDHFWVGAGNGTWFTGSANSKSQASGLAADATQAHDLLITTMLSTSSYDRGITFAVDSNGAGTAGWRLGKWHSGDARDSSKLVVDGQIFAKGGHTDEYDYYANDYSAYYSTQGGTSHWTGDGGWQTPGIVSSTAIQIQSGNYGASSRKPQLQFHQYGYGGIVQEYDGPAKVFHIKQTGDHRLNYATLTTNYGYLEFGPQNSSFMHFQTDRAQFYFNKRIVVDEGVVDSYDEDLILRRAQSNSHKLRINTSGAVLDGNLFINNGSPTVYLQDTDNRSSMVHCNSNIFYVLRGSGTNSTSWTQYASRWPLEINLENNDAVFGGNVTAYSDRKLKKDIEPIGNSMEIFSKLDAKRYRWKETGEDDIGFIAQDVQAAGLDVFVKENERKDPATGEVQDTQLTLDYSRMSALLWDVVKQQQSQIDTLTKRIEELENGDH